MLQTILPQLNGNIAQRRTQMWATQQFTADATDAAFGLVAGKLYTLWVAQTDGKTQSGKEVKKGDWFVVEVK
jgi:hypothetical protein